MSRKPEELNEKKYCLFCGKELIRKHYGKKIEDMKIFKNRKFCDLSCFGKYRSINADATKMTDRAARENAVHVYRALKDNDKCEICGGKGNLLVHHKDLDCHNNNIDNLMLLCYPCHNKIHHPKSYCIVEGCNNKVKGYGYCDKHYQRYKKYGSPYIVRWNTKHTKFDSDVINNETTN